MPSQWQDAIAFDRYKLSLGLVPGYTRVTALGSNPSLKAGKRADIWPGNNRSPVFDLVTAVAMEIVSSSAKDAASDSGAHTVLVTGLDDNYLQVLQTVVLNGMTPVALPLPLMRINSIAVVTTGSDRVNQGKLTVQGAGAGVAYAIVPKEIGVSQHCWYTVPAMLSLVVVHFFTNLNRPVINAWADVATWFHTPGGVDRYPPVFSVSYANPMFLLPAEPGILVPEKTDFGLRVLDVSADGLSVAAGFLACLINPSA